MLENLQQQQQHFPQSGTNQHISPTTKADHSSKPRYVTNLRPYDDSRLELIHQNAETVAKPPSLACKMSRPQTVPAPLPTGLLKNADRVNLAAQLSARQILSSLKQNKTNEHVAQRLLSPTSERYTTSVHPPPLPKRKKEKKRRNKCCCYS